jgi:hypothetical protein
MARRYDKDDFFEEEPETQIRALAILDEILRIAPRTDLRLIRLLQPPAPPTRNRREAHAGGDPGNPGV